jgi:hypothetical protein
MDIDIIELLEGHIVALGDVVAPPLQDRLTELANGYLAQGSQHSGATHQKELVQKYLKPEGIYIQPISMNMEVFNKLPKFAISVICASGWFILAWSGVCTVVPAICDHP